MKIDKLKMSQICMICHRLKSNGQPCLEARLASNNPELFLCAAGEVTMGIVISVVDGCFMSQIGTSRCVDLAVI